MIRAFLTFYFRRNIETWRELRRQCRAKLPMKDRPLA